MAGRQNQPAAGAVPISCLDSAMTLKQEMGSSGEPLPATEQENQGPQSPSPLVNVRSGTQEHLHPHTPSPMTELPLAAST